MRNLYEKYGPIFVSTLCLLSVETRKANVRSQDHIGIHFVYTSVALFRRSSHHDDIFTESGLFPNPLIFQTNGYHPFVLVAHFVLLFLAFLLIVMISLDSNPTRFCCSFRSTQRRIQLPHSASPLFPLLFSHLSGVDSSCFLQHLHVWSVVCPLVLFHHRLRHSGWSIDPHRHQRHPMLFLLPISCCASATTAETQDEQREGHSNAEEKAGNLKEHQIGVFFCHVVPCAIPC